MKLNLYLVLAVCTVLIAGCTQDWEDHYNQSAETVNENVWTAMQNNADISRFVAILIEHKLDSIFESDIPYTIVAPTNLAIENYMDTIDNTLLRYHIWTHFINTKSIYGKRKVQSMTEKFALFERTGAEALIDGVKILSESPLYLNGRYFMVDEVIEPKPNLYEYFKINNPLLREYIDNMDSVVLDKENSRPVGFNEEGFTIYDTVANVINLFELEYFKVKHEFRDSSCTVVFPIKEDYNAALNQMAEELGGLYIDYNDIPLDWQNNVLIPHLLNHGVFLNMLEPEEFAGGLETEEFKLLNILGDSIIVDYTLGEKAICSNGYAYNYQNFHIPDTLFGGNSKYEGEHLTVKTGIGKYAWNDNVKVESKVALNVLEELIPTASNDSIIRVIFPQDYTDNFSIEFEGPKMFPRKYIMEVSTHMDIGGIYDVYVNDELVKTFDYFDFILFRGIMFSVVPGEFYQPNGRFNSFDMYVENLTEYGSPTIRFEYKEKGMVKTNGFILDYINFIPAD